MSSVTLRRDELRRLLLMCVREVCLDVIKENLSFLCDVINNTRNKKKRSWVRDWIRRRDKLGASVTLMKELSIEDPKSYHNIMRLSVLKFNELLELVTPLIKKEDTKLRQAISCRTKLEITLRYIATGDSLKSLQYLFRVPHNTISTFLPRVLKAIYEVLEPLVRVPRTEEEWTKVQNVFESTWNFPNCCGALDGKHVQIRRPYNSTSQYFNYKGHYSIIVFVSVDGNYCFRYIDVGSDGRASDSTIFQTSTLVSALEQNLLGWPVLGVFVGDIFPLASNLLKPYSHRNLTLPERIFNFRLPRARRVVENAFGILAARFRVFTKPIHLNVDTAELVIKACCSIHNWLRMTASQTYFPPGSVDEEDTSTGEVNLGSWRQVQSALAPINKLYKSNNFSMDGEDVRQGYSHAFMTYMSVPWQKKICKA